MLRFPSVEYEHVYGLKQRPDRPVAKEVLWKEFVESGRYQVSDIVLGNPYIGMLEVVGIGGVKLSEYLGTISQVNHALDLLAYSRREYFNLVFASGLNRPSLIITDKNINELDLVASSDTSHFVFGEDFTYIAWVNSQYDLDNNFGHRHFIQTNMYARELRRVKRGLGVKNVNIRCLYFS